MLRTPSHNSANVRRLCRKIGGVEEPTFVDVSSRSASRPDDCFDDVRRQVEENGGGVQHGWTIWEWPGIFIEAEFHAVWRDPAGNLLDVTPKKDGEERILFAPDQKRVFSGRRLDNIRMAIGRDPRIKELLKLHEDLQRHLRRQMENIPFGTRFQLSDAALAIKRRAAHLEIELMQSRDARRASQTDAGRSVLDIFEDTA